MQRHRMGLYEKEGSDEGDDRQLSVNYLVIVTRRKKRYKFDMTEKEIYECIRILRILNPDMASGFPKGGRILLQSLSNTRDLGAIATADGRHILPRRLFKKRGVIPSVQRRQDQTGGRI